MCQLCLDGGAQTVGQTPRQTDTRLHRQISGRTDKHPKPALGQIRHSRKMTGSQAVPLPTAFPLCFAFSQMPSAARAKSRAARTNVTQHERTTLTKRFGELPEMWRRTCMFLSRRLKKMTKPESHAVTFVNTLSRSKAC